MASVQLINIEKTYRGGVPAVRGISLDIADGCFFVLLGPSGCGKSTLLRMIAGLETITRGDCLIGDRRVNDVEPADRDIAMVFQNYALYPHMTVFDNMAYGLRNRGLSRADINERVARVATSLQLSDFLQRKPQQLSGGQRQRVAMGRAIVRQPQVFLFDEPLSNLDAKLRAQVRLELHHLHTSLKVTSIFVTHDQTEAMTLGDRIAILNGGLVEQVGTPSDIYRRPSSLFVAGFIGSPPMNILAGEVIGAGQVKVAAGVLAFDPDEFSFQPGQKLMVGVRPDELHLVDAGSAGLDFTINLIEDLGSAKVLYGQTAGNAISVQVYGARDDLSIGISRAVSARPECVHLFDPVTGRSLRREARATTTATNPAAGLRL